MKTMNEQYMYILVSTFDSIFVLDSAFVINSLLFSLCALLCAQPFRGSNYRRVIKCSKKDLSSFE